MLSARHSVPCPTPTREFFPCSRCRVVKVCRNISAAVTSKSLQASAKRCRIIARSMVVRPASNEEETPNQLPSDVKLQVTDEGSIEYDEASKTLSVPLAAMGKGGRRSRAVMFTCNKCGGRTTRMVNPRSWESGLVFGQCSHCEVWHVLASNNPSIYEEIRYNRDEEDVPVPITASSGDNSSSSSEEMEQASPAISTEATEPDLDSLSMLGTQEPISQASLQEQADERSSSNSSEKIAGSELAL